MYPIITHVFDYEFLWQSDCPSQMHDIAIHYMQHCQAMLELRVCELAHSFFHSLYIQLYTIRILHKEAFMFLKHILFFISSPQPKARTEGIWIKNLLFCITGDCTEYNILGNLIQGNSKAKCSECPTFYRSKDAFLCKFRNYMYIQ